MAKTKKNKRGLSDKVRKTKHTDDVKVNPFEIKFNKTKHEVLGKKQTKYDKGMPGVSRSKAVKKRKETLLVEYKNRGKANKFVDRRLGEDSEMSLEDKMLQRFAKERQRQSAPGGRLFNLADEEEGEELTHYGQSLSQIEKFEEPDISDDDDDERGKIGAKIVEEEHFGGFLTKKAENKDDKLSWKEHMEQLIANSKKAKYERQSEKEKTLEATEKLDQEFKDLRKLISISKRPATEEPKKAVDDYDLAVRELKFEITGKPSDRLKTEEELAKDEMERLQELEADRSRRMRGLTEDEDLREKQLHRSADDLDDGFALGSNKKGKQFVAKYKDGKLLVSDESEDESDIDEKDEDDSEENESDDEMKGKYDMEEEEKEEEVKEKTQKKIKSKSVKTSDDNVGKDSDDEEEEEEEEEEAGSEDEESEDDAMQHFSDLESSDESDSDDNDKKDKKAPVSPQKKLGKVDKKSIIEGAKKELPYTFEMPTEYDGLCSLLEGHTDAVQVTILERVCACHHPSLAEGNKQKLGKLFSLLLQYCLDLGIADPPRLGLVDKLVPRLYTLMQQNPMDAAKMISNMVTERQELFRQYRERHHDKGVFPGLDTLLLLKLVSILLPTSDMRHPVVTPAMLFMSQILTVCPVTSCRDVASGLFVCGLFYQYVSFSKRFVPEVINFLQGVLFLSIDKDPNTIEPVIPPFKPVSKYMSLLQLSEQHGSDKVVSPCLKMEKVFSKISHIYLQSDEFKLAAVSHTLHMLSLLCELYEQLPSFSEIVSSVQHFLRKLPLNLYPLALQKQHEELVLQLDVGCTQKRKPLVLQKKKPMALPQFEPKVQEKFDGRKKRQGSKETQEKQRVTAEYKKEMKGALRQLRLDNKFIAREKLDVQISKDAERKRKVNNLFQQLAEQEGDYKRMKRQKDRMT